MFSRLVPGSYVVIHKFGQISAPEPKDTLKLALPARIMCKMPQYNGEGVKTHCLTLQEAR